MCWSARGTFTARPGSISKSARCRAIPAGHVVFIWNAGKPIVVFGGDVLFAGSIGRTDFPDGSFEQLATHIRSKLFSLPDDAQVLPGTDRRRPWATRSETNPFVGAPAGYKS